MRARLPLLMALVSILGAFRLATADDRQPAPAEKAISAVVKIGGCSGVCVHPDGIVLTAKHCQLGKWESVRFGSGQAFDAERIYVDPLAEGVVAFRCEAAGRPYPFRPIAAQVVQPPAAVWSAGYPAEANGQLVTAAGKMLGGVELTYVVDRQPQGKFRANNVDFATRPGWSGGPLFDGDGAVIGILSSGDATGSSFVSFAATRRAYQAAVAPPAKAAVANAEKTKLWLFGAPWCGPCKEFFRDVDRGKWGQVVARSDDGRRIETEQLEITYFNIDDPANLRKLRDVQAVLLKATGKTYQQSIPAIYVPGRAEMQIGYASTTGCFLIDGLKSMFSPPSTPIPESLSIAAIEIDLGEAAAEPEKYSRLKPEPEPEPELVTPFAPAEPAEDGREKGILDKAESAVAKADETLAKAEALVAKARSVVAAVKGEPIGDGKEEEPAGWSLLGLLTVIGGFYRKFRELRGSA